jgi:RimJ/RimL family protein N-acetyltransferase
VIAEIASENVASRRVAEKIGMRRVVSAKRGDGQFDRYQTDRANGQ